MKNKRKLTEPSEANSENTSSKKDPISPRMKMINELNRSIEQVLEKNKEIELSTTPKVFS